MPQEQIGSLDPDSKLAARSTRRSPKRAPRQGEKPPLETLINLSDFEEAARQTISRKNWAFISGASNDNITRDANKDFFAKIWFRPRILRNVSSVSTNAAMMGCNVSLPVWISPAGLGKTGGPEGEIALSRGAAETGIIQTVSRDSENIKLLFTTLDIDECIIPIAGNSRRRTRRISLLLPTLHQQRPGQNRRASSTHQQQATDQGFVCYSRSASCFQARSRRTLETRDHAIQ